MNRPTKLSAQQSYPLYTVEATRAIEQLASACLPNHTLMQRAGLAAAQWTLALAPHAQHIWVACGPGNNGGDGFETALMLHRFGKKVSITWTEHAQNAGPPARRHLHAGTCTLAPARWHAGTGVHGHASLIILVKDSQTRGVLGRPSAALARRYTRRFAPRLRRFAPRFFLLNTLVDD